MSQENLPLKYGVVLFPGFQALDIFGPLDILNLLSQTQPLELSILAATLNPVSTSLLADGFGQKILPTHTFADAPTDLEVVIVPGGLGTRNSQNIAPVIDFVKRIFPKLKFLLTVCTGSAVAAMAGVLDGRRATSNKMALKWVMTQGPNVKWVVRARWVDDGNVWTSSGISAGIDMTYAFISKQYGENVAQTLADRAEYHRNTDADDDQFADFSGL